MTGAIRGRLRPNRRQTISVVPPVSAGLSVERALQRRAILSDLAGGRETPPGFEAARPFTERRGDAAEAVRIEIERRSIPLLLAARVTDAVLTILESLWSGRAFTSRIVDDIAYQCSVRPSDSKRDGIGMRVQIECRQPEFIAQVLRDVSPDYLGIETVVRYGEPPVPLGQGVVGGYLDGIAVPPDAGRNFVGMTCHHVELADEHVLHDFSVPPGPDYATSCPDAKLVLLGQSTVGPEFVNPGTEGAVGQMMRHRHAVTTRPRRRSKGVVLGMMNTFPYQGVLQHFPTLLMHARNWRMLGMTLPQRPFSKAGDSGSWVVEPVTNSWLGMVIAGDPDTGNVYVNSAEALQLLLRNGGFLTDRDWVHYRASMER